ncbi:transposase [Chryseobacterium oranimense]|uniref:transposase n=1 Tax=Chryseobacterium oranimense TaxID=421058 RepID=UPI0031E2173F
MNFKDIHIGKFINQRVTEYEIEMSRICNFLHCNEEKVKKMFQEKSLDTETLLRWSKLLNYDFFRIYTQHLILYAPVAAIEQKPGIVKSSLPQFRKNIYTKEIIDFILDQIRTGKISKNEVIKKYRIPKTTLYKWIEKYKN